MMLTRWPVLVAVGVVGAALIYTATRGAKGAGQAIGGAVVDLADGVVTGTVKGVGGVLGIPDTDATKCAAAKAAGNTWEASFYCPAGEFLGWATGLKK